MRRERGQLVVVQHTVTRLLKMTNASTNIVHLPLLIPAQPLVQRWDTQVVKERQREKAKEEIRRNKGH